MALCWRFPPTTLICKSYYSQDGCLVFSELTENSIVCKLQRSVSPCSIAVQTSWRNFINVLRIAPLPAGFIPQWPFSVSNLEETVWREEICFVGIETGNCRNIRQSVWHLKGTTLRGKMYFGKKPMIHSKSHEIMEPPS